MFTYHYNFTEPGSMAVSTSKRAFSVWIFLYKKHRQTKEVQSKLKQTKTPPQVAEMGLFQLENLKAKKLFQSQSFEKTEISECFGFSFEMPFYCNILKYLGTNHPSFYQSKTFPVKWGILCFKMEIVKFKSWFPHWFFPCLSVLLTPEVAFVSETLPWCNSPLPLATYSNQVQHKPEFLFL